MFHCLKQPDFKVELICFLNQVWAIELVEISCHATFKWTKSGSVEEAPMVDSVIIFNSFLGIVHTYIQMNVPYRGKHLSRFKFPPPPPLTCQNSQFQEKMERNLQCGEGDLQRCPLFFCFVFLFLLLLLQRGGGGGGRQVTHSRLSLTELITAHRLPFPLPPRPFVFKLRLLLVSAWIQGGCNSDTGTINIDGEKAMKKWHPNACFC